jgi:hypothetical protein
LPFALQKLLGRETASLLGTPRFGEELASKAKRARFIYD